MSHQLIDKIITILNPQRYKEEDKYLDDLMTEYKEKKPLYEEFRLATHKALEALLHESGEKHQIISRTKTPEGLREKIIRKRSKGSYYHSVEEVEDLVGLRIVFYTERDKEKFIKKIKEEIAGFMRVEEREKENGYRATHVVMSFGPTRLNLSEFKHFKGMKSEVQITSVLHHAWAELEHDLIYKDVGKLKERNPEKFELMKKRMNDLLEKYIHKASEELEKIIESGAENPKP